METNNRLIKIEIKNSNYPVEFTAKEFKVLDNGCIEIWAVGGLIASYNKDNWSFALNESVESAATNYYVPGFVYEALDNYIEVHSDDMSEMLNPVKAWFHHINSIKEMGS